MGDPRSEMTRKYNCDACGVEGVKLWRGVHGCKDSEGRELKCARCLTDEPVDDAGVWFDGDLGMRHCQVGGWLPACPTGDTYWGYTSIPDTDVAWWRALPTYAPKPDPRDARIAELEAALAGLAVAAVDAASFDVCHEDQCPRLSTWWRVAVGNAAWESCDEHIAGFRAEDAKAESKGCRRREGWREREGADEVRAFGAAIEAAERALGRRK